MATAGDSLTVAKSCDKNCFTRSLVTWQGLLYASPHHVTRVASYVPLSCDKGCFTHPHVTWQGLLPTSPNLVTMVASYSPLFMWHGLLHRHLSCDKGCFMCILITWHPIGGWGERWKGPPSNRQSDPLIVRFPKYSSPCNILCSNVIRWLLKSMTGMSQRVCDIRIDGNYRGCHYKIFLERPRLEAREH